MDNNITVRIDSELKDWLKEYAYQNRMSISEVLRACIENLKAKENS